MIFHQNIILLNIISYNDKVVNHNIIAFSKAHALNFKTYNCQTTLTIKAIVKKSEIIICNGKIFNQSINSQRIFVILSNRSCQGSKEKNIKRSKVCRSCNKRYRL